MSLVKYLHYTYVPRVGDHFATAVHCVVAMNIVVTTTSYPRYLGDGAGTFIHSMCRSLVEAGHNVQVFACDDPQASDTWQNAVPVSRVRYVWPRRWATLGHGGALQADTKLHRYIYLLTPLYVLASTIALLKHLRHNRCDVIYAQWIVPGGLVGSIVSMITGVPLVVSAHGSDIHVIHHNLLSRIAGRWAIRQARAVVACSWDFREKLVNFGAPVTKTFAIPYGVDSMAFWPDPSAPTTIRGSLNLENRRNVLLCMGRLVHKKGFDFVIRALPAILEHFPDTTLMVLGSGVLADALLEEAHSLGVAHHVVFMGHVDWQEVGTYLAGATIVLVPSIVDHAGNVDGLPNVLLEAMACGSAIVASRVAGIPDVISSSVNGILVPEKDSDALASAVITLLENPKIRSQLGENARKTALTELGWESVAARLVSVLDRAVRSR